jgi:tetratricopeptide (TPR) repeat protein
LLTQLYIETHQEQQAIEQLNASVAKEKSVHALLLLGSIHEQLKNFTAARDAYEQLLTLSRNFVPALNNLAVIYSEHLGQLDRALELAKQARNLAPNAPAVSDTLGWILFKQRDLQGAIQLLQDAASQVPDEPEVQFHVGMAHYMRGEEEPARVALQRAVDLGAGLPGLDDARQVLAVLAMEKGSASAGARSELENYLQSRPDDPVALVRLAELQQRDGALDQAMKTYERVIAGYPQFGPAMRELTVLYSHLSTDVAKAIELAQRARQAYPDDAEVTKSLGILNYRRDAHLRAAELLKEAASKRKDDPELLYYLGATSVQLKRLSDCKPALESALSMRPPRELADKVRRALAQCSDLAP